MQLFHRTYGEGEPMVILHGLFGSCDNWMTQARMLGAHFTVHTVDLRNHGLSPHDPVHSYEAMSADVVGFLREKSDKPVTLIGHSMGGKVAMHVAVHHPELVKRLIVVDIVPKEYPPHHNRLLEGLLAMDVATIGTRQDADTRLSTWVPQPDVRQFLLKNLSRKPEGGFDWKINLAAIAGNLNDIFSNPLGNGTYSGPSQFIMGSRSDYFTPGDEQIIERYFPSATISFLNTGHWVQAEQPEGFVKEVLHCCGIN
ncbi:MAG: alpha/beta fold hydrolase [Bacteroidota bacterium]